MPPQPASRKQIERNGWKAPKPPPPATHRAELLFLSMGEWLSAVHKNTGAVASGVLEVIWGRSLAADLFLRRVAVDGRVSRARRNSDMNA